MKASRSTLFLALILPTVGLVALLVAAGSGQTQPSPTTVKQHVVDVMAVDVQPSYQQQRLVFGQVEATQYTQMGFELSGTVKQVYVDDGQPVQPGTVLAELDTQRLHAQRKQAVAALDRATANARLASLSQQRIADLVTKKLESRQRLDEAEQSLAVANAGITEAQAQVDRIDVELSKSVLIAPYQGTVVNRQVDGGTTVAAGQPVLALQQATQRTLRFPLPSDKALSLMVGQGVTVLAADAKGHYGQAIDATVDAISQQRDPRTRTVDVLVSTTGDSEPLLPGDTLAMPLTRTVQARGSWVPKSALSSGVRGLWTVLTVAGEGAQEVIPVSVEVMFADGDRVYVRGPLSSGDFVVVHGTQRLVPHQQVVARTVDAKLTAGVR
ncbi:efflux RND transporter periplasmic adaptor subunit [Aestuariibacter halophilus]|uniref:Efflux RND transporter periplasmic adaptor subunit n=1 Tax=Fluctibacter halophilus TaxID=226011 RepID=A0ABS8G9Y4_9ALTE|nr:efflux RND transporter periplasmic adaptor subunit [Aestuariibacter halophilus]MCC2617402.1 efflux RND transporter periplasmic adaptor subunit [Aestuariibacter halophilus]